MVVDIPNGELVTTFYRWRWPSGRYGNVAWRFRTKRECEKHYKGFQGKAVRRIEVDAPRKRQRRTK